MAKDEMTRQCEMAWERGRQYGIFQACCVAVPLLIWALIGIIILGS